MLEKLPASVGKMLKHARAGMGEVLFNDRQMVDILACIEVRSPAFGMHQPIPARYTADGDELSPPIEWTNVPTNAAAMVLLIEDADSPTPEPLVHAIVWDLPPGSGAMAEGAMPSPPVDGRQRGMGLNSYFRASYLPPDPPPGHGPHRYAFQLYALDHRPHFTSPPGRGALIDTMRGHVLAKGCLIGTYERR